MPERGLRGLREEALRCRRLARGASTDDVADLLRSLADEYEAQADELEARSMDEMPNPVMRPRQE
jgi:hypothetical protein